MVKPSRAPVANGGAGRAISAPPRAVETPAAERLYHHYEMLRASHPGPLLDRLYLRLAAPVGVVAPPPRPVGGMEIPNFSQVPLAHFEEAVRLAMSSTAGLEALDLFARSAGRPGDRFSLVRRAVALRAVGKLTKEVAMQAWGVYTRERLREPALEGLVSWLL